MDLTDRLQQAVREGINVYAPTDTHWSSEGHAVVAAELERVLRDQCLVLPPELGSQTEREQLTSDSCHIGLRQLTIPVLH
jgi:hypothetical protein